MYITYGVHSFRITAASHSQLWLQFHSAIFAEDLFWPIEPNHSHIQTHTRSQRWITAGDINFNCSNVYTIPCASFKPTVKCLIFFLQSILASMRFDYHLIHIWYIMHIYICFDAIKYICFTAYWIMRAEVRIKIGNEFATLLCWCELINALTRRIDASIVYGSLTVCQLHQTEVFTVRIFAHLTDIQRLCINQRSRRLNNIVDTHIYWLSQSNL